MPILPPWVLIAFALLSAHFVGRRQGVAYAIPRLYIAVMYVVILSEALGDPAQNNSLYLAINRYGFLLVFLADIIPATVDRWRGRKPHDAN